MRTFGKVKWFDAATGRGCVVSDGGAQAALVKAQLAPFGLQSIDEGVALSFEIRLDGGRLVVSRIYDIAGRLPPIADGMRGDPPVRPVRRGRSARGRDGAKGYGFVVSDHVEGDVLLHQSVIDVFGAPGGDAGKGGAIYIGGVGPLVIPPPWAHDAGMSGGSIAISLPLPPWERAVCRWFSRPKGFGFVRLTERGEDVFVHMDTLRKCGMRELRQRQRVRVRVSDDWRGPAALEIEPAEDGEA